MIASILKGTDDLMSIPTILLKNTLKTIRYIETVDQDILMRHQATRLLDLIKEKIQQKINIYSPKNTILNILV